MGQTVPSQHPAVVLRSHFNQLRALLAVALIAVIGLTVTVVILARDEDQTAGINSAAPIGHLNNGGFNPSTGRPYAAPLAKRDAQSPITGTRYHGGPDEGTRGIRLYEQQLRMFGFTPRQAAREALSGTRYDGGPDEGTRGPLKDHSKNPATGDHDNSTAPPPSTRYDGGPDEGTRGPRYHTP